MLISLHAPNLVCLSLVGADFIQNLKHGLFLVVVNFHQVPLEVELDSLSGHHLHQPVGVLLHAKDDAQRRVVQDLGLVSNPLLLSTHIHTGNNLTGF